MKDYNVKSVQCEEKQQKKKGKKTTKTGNRSKVKVQKSAKKCTTKKVQDEKATIWKK